MAKCGISNIRKIPQRGNLKLFLSNLSQPGCCEVFGLIKCTQRVLKS
nr:MAG TPA: hypothetical protein [Caudoviricetes sp.]